MIAACAQGLVVKPISMTSGTKDHIVVVGGGIGGLSTSFDLRHNLPKDTHISVVSDRPSFQLAPSNPRVSVGTRTAKDISVPMIEACKAGHVDYVPGKLTLVDAAKKVIHLLVDGKVTIMPYVYLVGATRPKLDWHGVLDPSNHSGDIAEVSVCTTPHA
jgi:sulfide:quinone oxidoreductase